MDHSRVEIDGGLIEGEILNSELNEEPYYSFKGVPYARPPVGALRFQPPERVEKWDGVIQCTKDGNMCCQRCALSENPLGFGGSENCLYLNIFFPAENPNKCLRPVMVFVHGGAFSFGSSDTNYFGPDFLVTKGVVLVTINYRVNIFGFLNLGIEECRGNVGLLDQRAALIWVKNNIEKFSGDPKNVTVFGESAGSASVHYHLLSPLSKGLFHKAILQSGCSLDPWAYMDPALSVERAFRVGKHLGCTTTDVKELYKFLLDVPANTLSGVIFAALSSTDSAASLGVPFVPSRETVGAFEERFIPDDPKNLLTAPEVSVLCGLNSAEGAVAFITGPAILPKILEHPEPAVDSVFPKYLLTNHAKIEEAKSKVRQFYLKGDGSDSAVVNNFVDFFGDISFGLGNYSMLKAYLSLPMQKPIYLYLYDFETKAPSIIRQLGSLPDYLRGAFHADELPLLFKCRAFDSFKFDSEESASKSARVTDHLTTIWTNFAKFGNPNGDLKINWEPISSKKVSYCKINDELEIQPGFIFEERMRFWNELSSANELLT